MVAAGPIPGRTPMRVPTKQPTETQEEIDRRKGNPKSSNNILEDFHRLNSEDPPRHLDLETDLK